MGLRMGTHVWAHLCIVTSQCWHAAPLLSGKCFHSLTFNSDIMFQVTICAIYLRWLCPCIAFGNSFMSARMTKSQICAVTAFSNVQICFFFRLASREFSFYFYWLCKRNKFSHKAASDLKWEGRKKKQLLFKCCELKMKFSIRCSRIWILNGKNVKL